MASAFPPTTPTSPIDRSAWRSAYRSESFVNVDDQELAQVRSQLQTFVSQHQDSNTDYTEGAITITKLHWINSSQRSKCHNSSCKLKFTLTQRKHHCRKCGEVFCAKCLQYQRKLSPTAEYDPNGKLYMVCAVCFNSETQGRGQARFWTQTFAEMRRDYLAERARFIDSTNTKPTRPYLLKECQRLVDGFSKNQTSINPTQTGKEAENEDVTKASKFFKRLGSLTTKVSKVPSLVKTGPPEWQKPDTWVPNGPNCQFCGTAFTYKKHNCYICGRLVCLTCSCKDLLIYVPDKCNHEHEGKHARWAVIKIIGSPEIEPDKRLYVRTCKVCLEELTALQVDNYKASMNGEDKDQDCMSKMMEIHGNITKFQDKIDEMLPKYKQLIDSLEIAADSPKSLPPTRNNMQVLAKHQGDLADHFTSFVVAVSRLKQLKPRTQTQLKLVKLLMRSKFSYYSDSMYTFRQLKKRLEQISPPEVLQAIQSIVDSQVIRHNPTQTLTKIRAHRPQQGYDYIDYDQLDSEPEDEGYEDVGQTPTYNPEQKEVVEAGETQGIGDRNIGQTPTCNPEQKGKGQAGETQEVGDKNVGKTPAYNPEQPKTEVGPKGARCYFWPQSVGAKKLGQTPSTYNPEQKGLVEASETQGVGDKNVGQTPTFYPEQKMAGEAYESQGDGDKNVEQTPTYYQEQKEKGKAGEIQGVGDKNVGQTPTYNSEKPKTEGGPKGARMWEYIWPQAVGARNVGQAPPTYNPEQKEVVEAGETQGIGDGNIGQTPTCNPEQKGKGQAGETQEVGDKNVGKTPAYNPEQPKTEVGPKGARMWESRYFWPQPVGAKSVGPTPTYNPEQKGAGEASGTEGSGNKDVGQTPTFTPEQKGVGEAGETKRGGDNHIEHTSTYPEQKGVGEAGKTKGGKYKNVGQTPTYKQKQKEAGESGETQGVDDKNVGQTPTDRHPEQPRTEGGTKGARMWESLRFWPQPVGAKNVGSTPTYNPDQKGAGEVSGTQEMGTNMLEDSKT
ncbi:uncharacterized protein LOC119723433 isoform X3 [Patiria miniata]|uniref:FYVE-type domain-containing protein n=1 Tax=Patiria miniata TaxID=46514 RepID=A0A913ZG36_PATMI|nr:uncharacterized protein LOC119723433 isoform X3 [Patiria miniata]